MTETRRQFFDRIANQWDGWMDLERMARTLTAGLEEFGLDPAAAVVDLGCGTGNLSRALVRHLGPAGRVWAVDFSRRMLDEARRKVADVRVEWVEGDAVDIPLPDGVADDIVCFSSWPHFPEPSRAAVEQWRILRPGGTLTVWHALPRERINSIHRDAGVAVQRDLLPPGSELAQLFADSSFDVVSVQDDDERYVVRARRRDG
jgi:demethylmenaquinone methyltransferase/2-methoxy-6-polyprenyl-1,4-benzoquinol methylase